MNLESIRGACRQHARPAAAAALLALAAVLALMAPGASTAPAAGPADPADLSLTKTDSPDPVTVGAQLTYTIAVANAGPDAATNVMVSDDLTNRVDFVSATASSGSCQGPPGKGHGGKLTCNLGTVSNGGTATVMMIVTPNKAGTISNTASVSSDVTDPQPSNDSDTETTTVHKAPPGPTCLGKAATLVGTLGNDTLTGTDKPDVIVALAGNDQVLGLGGKDLICAGGGADVVDAGPRPDRVSGGSGPDRLLGRGGGDELRGKAGRDRLRGNAGNDLLAGGRGRDRCRGGPGSDTLRSCER
jgi:uncharacterized repeat protein (TIGR01451 family)